MATYELNQIVERLDRIESGLNAVMTAQRQILVALGAPDQAQQGKTTLNGAQQTPIPETQAPAESGSAPPESSAPTKSETAGNTQTVGTQQVGAAKSS